MPDRSTPVALAMRRNGEGRLEVMVRFYEDQLRPLFERDLEIGGRVIPAWSQQAFEHICSVELERAGFAGELSSDS